MPPTLPDQSPRLPLTRDTAISLLRSVENRLGRLEKMTAASPTLRARYNALAATYSTEQLRDPPRVRPTVNQPRTNNTNEGEEEVRVVRGVRISINRSSARPAAGVTGALARLVGADSNIPAVAEGPGISAPPLGNSNIAATLAGNNNAAATPFRRPANAAPPPSNYNAATTPVRRPANAVLRPGNSTSSLLRPTTAAPTRPTAASTPRRLPYIRPTTTPTTPAVPIRTAANPRSTTAAPPPRRPTAPATNTTPRHTTSVPGPPQLPSLDELPSPFRRNPNQVPVLPMLFRGSGRPVPQTAQAPPPRSMDQSDAFCSVCMEQVCDTVLMDCKHQVVCQVRFFLRHRYY